MLPAKFLNPWQSLHDTPHIATQWFNAVIIRNQARHCMPTGRRVLNSSAFQPLPAFGKCTRVEPLRTMTSSLCGICPASPTSQRENPGKRWGGSLVTQVVPQTCKRCEGVGAGRSVQADAGDRVLEPQNSNVQRHAQGHGRSFHQRGPHPRVLRRKFAAQDGAGTRQAPSSLCPISSDAAACARHAATRPQAWHTRRHKSSAARPELPVPQSDQKARPRIRACACADCHAQTHTGRPCSTLNARAS